MTWLITPNAALPATERLPWYRRLWWRLRYLRAAPVARVALTNADTGSIVTHPNNVTTICEFLTAHGHNYRVGAPTLHTVAGGRK